MEDIKGHIHMVAREDDVPAKGVPNGAVPGDVYFIRENNDGKPECRIIRGEGDVVIKDCGDVYTKDEVDQKVAGITHPIATDEEWTPDNQLGEIEYTSDKAPTVKQVRDALAELETALRGQIDLGATTWGGISGNVRDQQDLVRLIIDLIETETGVWQDSSGNVSEFDATNKRLFKVNDTYASVTSYLKEGQYIRLKPSTGTPFVTRVFAIQDRDGNAWIVTTDDIPEHIRSASGVTVAIQVTPTSDVEEPTPFDKNIIGVVDTGARTVNGATLAWIDKDFNVINNIESSFFNIHAAYQFADTLVGTNYFRKIPVAYWKRGTVPSGLPNAGKWYMMMSPTPSAGFTASPAFMFNGESKDSFLISTYRAANIGGVPGSQPDKTSWSNISFTDATTKARNLGTGYHMLSIYEWHEICARAVIEKKTFDIMPESVRSNQAACKYRGIEDFCYSGSVYYEWLEGIRTDANKKLQVWSSNGNQSYITTAASPQIGNQYIRTLLSGEYFDHLFIASQGTSNQAESMIPDYNHTAVGPCVCCVAFSAGHAYCGAFHSYSTNSATYTNTNLGFRLAKV